MNKEWIAALPKMDLHCHLDGGVHPQRIRDYLTAQGEEIPPDLDAHLSVEEDCASLTEYLGRFAYPLRYLQTGEALTQTVLDLLRDARRENTRYIELRFAPALHLACGLTYGEVFRALQAGMDQGLAETGVVCRFIVCAMRHLPEETNLAMLEASAPFFPQLVCACDLAGDENAFPQSRFIPLFRRARELGLPYTIHAGEQGSRENIALSLDLGARRLGHGIAMLGDEALLSRCRMLGVGIELCPTSNFQTKAAPGWENYPMLPYLRAGLCAALNTDNRTVSRTDLNREYLRAMEEGGASRADVLRLLENACAMSFAPPEVKGAYLAELDEFR